MTHERQQVFLPMRRQVSWILYDIASSGYVLLIGAVVFPIYLKIHVAENAAWSDAAWGALLALANVLAGVVAPVVGAAADIAGRRVRYLAVATAACSLACLLLATPGAGYAYLATVFVLSFAAYHVAAGLYDALLKSVSNDRSAGLLSSLGWGLGYVGGLACYVMASRAGGSGDVDGFLFTFLIVGIYYGALGSVALYGLRGSETPAAARGQWPAALARVVATAAKWQTGGAIPRLIVGAHCITGAVATMALFSPLMLASHFGLAVADVATLGAIFSLLSIPATLFAGWLTLRVDALRLFQGLLPLWLAIVVLLAFGTGWWAGLALACCLGLTAGPTNAIARCLVVAVIEEADAAQMFGFAAMVNRLSSAIGPLFFGLLSSASPIRWPAVAMAAIMLAAGVIVMPRRHLRHTAAAG